MRFIFLLHECLFIYKFLQNKIINLRNNKRKSKQKRSIKLRNLFFVICSYFALALINRKTNKLLYIPLRKKFYTNLRNVTKNARIGTFLLILIIIYFYEKVNIFIEIFLRKKINNFYFLFLVELCTCRNIFARISYLEIYRMLYFDVFS
jgi:hypothetical protein